MTMLSTAVWESKVANNHNGESFLPSRDYHVIDVKLFYYHFDEVPFTCS